MGERVLYEKAEKMTVEFAAEIRRCCLQGESPNSLLVYSRARVDRIIELLEAIKVLAADGARERR